MVTFKSKSLTPEKTDFEIKNGYYSIRFISFESAVKSFNKEYNINDKPIGYRVTEQGIEICYE